MNKENLSIQDPLVKKITSARSIEVVSDLSIAATLGSLMAAFNSETGASLDRTVTAATFLLLFSALSNIWARQIQYRESH